MAGVARTKPKATTSPRQQLAQGNNSPKASKNPAPILEITPLSYSLIMRSKAMGLGAMFIFLVAAVMILPAFVRWVSAIEPHYVISGFQDLNAAAQVEETRNQVLSVPQMGQTSQLPVWRPDPNTDYVCRSPGGGDQPCPEGTFCDGSSQSCVSLYAGGDVPSDGYYA